MNTKLLKSFSFICASLVACATAVGVAVVQPERDGFIIGADLSALSEVQRANAIYTVDGVERPVLEIFQDAGYEVVRLRLFLEADGRWGAVNDLETTLAIATQVVAAGFGFMLDFHYSDTWADPGPQSKPKTWVDLSYEELVQKVYDYTYETLKVFEARELTPQYVQIGNEVTPGMLWPDGRVSGEGYETDEQWAKFAELLQSGCQAVDAALPQNTPKKIVHIDRGGSPGVVKYFFEHLGQHRVDYDIIGLSHYPFYHNTMDELRESLTYIDTVLQKPFILVETGHPHAELHEADAWHPSGYPHTPEGQYQYLYELTEVVSGFRHGKGIFYWYGEGIPTKLDPKPWCYGKNALFSKKGAALPALYAMADALKARTLSKSASSKPEKLNVLLIFAEDLGLQIGPYGDHTVPTPALDALATKGTVFENAYATAATCSPSRSSLFTGRYPFQTGHLGLASNYGYSVSEGNVLFTELLKAAGYTLGLSYKIHVNPADRLKAPFDFLYDHSRIQKDHTDTKDWKQHLAYFSEFLDARDPAKPFYYQAQTHDTHEPFGRGAFKDAPAQLPYRTLKPGEAKPLPAFGKDIKRTDWLNKQLAAYYNSIQRVDAYVGGLMEELERRGLRDSTLVVFSADHGPSFTRGKLSVHELGLRVPLIVSWPDAQSVEQRSSAIASLLDLAPTFMEAARLPIHEAFMGSSLRSIVQTGVVPSDWRDAYVAEYDSHTSVDWWPMRSLRDDRYKLIVNLLAGTEHADFLVEGERIQSEGIKADRLASHESPDGGETSAIYERAKNPPRFELYDLQADPIEAVNLAERPEYAARLQAMNSELHRFLDRHGDPLASADFLDRFTRAQIVKQKEIRSYEMKNGKGSFWGKSISYADWSEWLHQ
jgi:arabinogalactan endo-1,4-beta-galactosidase/arylsulfatase A-like enzyme